ncbi:IclR family transcriptional regulator [Salinigranum sp. GCM10025319]|uniref:IclR family transcriptional regulator n=1 Tax=Salinigranum sp. GCM10025319 TaxID=3252687 RepID=UPI003611FE7D
MKREQADSGGRQLKTVRTALAVVDALCERDECGVTELADVLSLPKSTVYAQLNTLRAGGFVRKTDGRYRLSYKFLTLGEYVRNRSALYRIAKPEVDELADETGQYAHLVTEEYGRGINIYKAKGETSVGEAYQASKFQQRDYLHITASGKAILAFLPKARVEEVLAEHGLPSRTERTITDRETLFERLSEVRERGYSYNDQEEVMGLRAVGAPIRRPDGAVLGSVSVSGPTSYLDDERFTREVPELVQSTANVIEVNLNMADRSAQLADYESRTPR